MVIFMKIRLGYVALPLTLNKVTSSSLMTYTYYKKLEKETANSKLNKIIISNLEDLEKILIYNVKNNIHFYRLSSRIIPLATHKDVDFEYLEKYNDYFLKISKIINDSNMRIDTHPDQFCVLNSDNSETVTNSIIILNFHKELMKKLNVKRPISILHIGSNKSGKRNAMKRFIDVFNILDEEVKKMITIENDDKIFNIRNTLKISNAIKVPMTLDFHHHLCNNNGEKIEDFIEKIVCTWNDIDLNPKMHFSSPKGKNKKDRRNHSDYIDSDKFIEFIEKIKFINRDVDIMIEAKMKDMALFKLMREIKYKTDYKIIDDTTFEVF